MAAFAVPPYPIRASGAAVPAFVGRVAETSAAEEAWAAVRAGGRQVIFIGGEPGAGKSRLAAEIAAALHRAGAVVLLGTCPPGPGGPYQPFAECLEQLLGGTEAGSLASCLPDTAAELLRLTPLVWRHRPELSAPDGDGGDYRRELFDAMAGLLDAVGELRPVVCVLEDLHWAGQPTLQLLGHVTRRSAASRLLLLCTHRTTAPDRSDDLTYAIADLYRLDGVRRVDLSGLSAEEVAQYLVAEGGLTARRSREYAAVLRDQTGGNPFFLRELWRDMTAGLSGPLAVGARDLGTRAPVSVRETLQRRLSRMTPGERAVLETAAVLGDGGEARVVVRACVTDADGAGPPGVGPPGVGPPGAGPPGVGPPGAGPPGVGPPGAGPPGVGAPSVEAPGAGPLAALDTAVRFGFLDGADLAHGRIAFPHTLTRQAVLDLAGPSRLAVLHARVGEVLRSAESDTPAVTRQLAYHFARANALGYGGVAAGYLRQAARDAERSLAFEDAADWYAQAADLLDGPESAREELRLAAADSHVRAGDFASARNLYLGLAGSADSQVRLRAAIGYEGAAWRPGLPGADARALLSHALEGVPEDPDDPWYVRALASLGRATAFTGDAERSRHLAEQALALARRIGDPQLLLHALEAMLWQRGEPHDVSRHLALADELRVLAKANGEWSALGTGAVFGCAIAYIRADRAAWEAATADLDLAVRGSGEPFLAFMRRCGDYARVFLDGDFASAAAMAEDLLDIGRSFGPDGTEGQYGLQMYMVRRETGGLEETRPLLGVMALAPDTWEPGLLTLYTELGLLAEARDLLWRLLARIDASIVSQPPWAQWTAVLVFLTEAALALRDTEAARRLRPLLAPYSGQQLIAGHFVAVFGPADAYLAALDSLLGDPESAERLFGAALAQATGFGALIHRAWVLAAWAAQDSDARATEARAAQMRAEARRLAAGAGHARLLHMLDTAGEPPAANGPGEVGPGTEGPDNADSDSAGPDAVGLTPRETAVLRLLAEGSSNREIATRLKITENTAANHVRSILTKTGAANRTQAAMMAASRGWLDAPA